MKSNSYRAIVAEVFLLDTKFSSSLLAKPRLNSAMPSFTCLPPLSVLTLPTSLDQSAARNPANAAVFTEHFSAAVLT